MRMAQAKKIASEGIKPKGFRVSFQRVEGKILHGDHFPARDEPMFENEQDAWDWARKFAAATTGRCVNIYVVDDRWSPVPGYQSWKIDNRE